MKTEPVTCRKFGICGGSLSEHMNKTLATAPLDSNEEKTIRFNSASFTFVIRKRSKEFDPIRVKGEGV